MNLKRAKIIGFVSIKGGVGKTTAVSNLGLILTKDFKKKVLIVDGNFSGPNLALHFGFNKVGNNLHDVFEGKVNLHKAIYEHKSGLHLLPASLYSRKVDYTRFHQYMAALRSYYDLILIDSSPASNAEMLATVLASDELFVITTPDHVTLSSTMHAIKMARQKKTYISGIILNKVKGKKYEVGLDYIQDLTKVPVVSVLRDDERMLEALSKSKPLAAINPYSNSVVEYKKLAAALIGERYKDKRIGTQLKNLFSKRVTQDEVNRAIIMVSHY